MPERKAVIPAGGHGRIEFHPEHEAIVLIADDTIDSDTGFIDIELDGQRQNIFRWMPAPVYDTLGINYVSLVNATMTAHERAVLKRLHRRVLNSREQAKQQHPRFL